MLGNIGNLFVKCMLQGTEGHLKHLKCISSGPSQFCETSAKVTNWVTDVSPEPQMVFIIIRTVDCEHSIETGAF